MNSTDDLANRRQRQTGEVESFDTVVIGGGQAGLSVGYYLAKHGRPFVILDGNERDRGLMAQPLGFTPLVHTRHTSTAFPACASPRAVARS